MPVMTTSNQQIQFAETIRAMKLALKRRASAADDSDCDSDDSLHVATNRGNKLNHRAKHIREGRLDTTGGQVYKRKVTHAGYERHIIAKRPKLYDEDGEVIAPDDLPSDADEDAFPGVGPIEADPFGQVRLERLLRPLTSAADLPEHPSLSQAYTSKALSQMAEEAARMVRREKATLWKAKRLLGRFRGDGLWMACERFTTPQDALLLQDQDEGLDSALQSVALDESVQENIDTDGAFAGTDDGPGQQPEDARDNGEAMNGVEIQDHVANAQPVPAQQEHVESNGFHLPAPPNGTADTEAQPGDPNIHTQLHDHDDPSDDDANSNSRSSANAPSHRMTTRARARSPQLPNSPSPSQSDFASIPSIHPWFVAPNTALSDRDLGLPAPEAEDTRKLLLLYVQKQENIVRQLEALYAGLQRTDRLRHEVWRACKAEAHLVPTADGKGLVSEMSDGEDWYDVADWNLEGRLVKGKDEIEDPAEEEGRRVGGRRRRVVGRQGGTAAM